MNAVNETSLRAVTHYDVSREGVELAVQAIGEVASSGVKASGLSAFATGLRPRCLRDRVFFAQRSACDPVPHCAVGRRRNRR